MNFSILIFLEHFSKSFIFNYSIYLIFLNSEHFFDCLFYLDCENGSKPLMRKFYKFLSILVKLKKFFDLVTK